MTPEQEQKLTDLETIIRRNNIEMWAMTITLTTLKRLLIEKKILDESEVQKTEEEISKQVMEEIEKHADAIREGKGTDIKIDLPTSGPSGRVNGF